MKIVRNSVSVLLWMLIIISAIGGFDRVQGFWGEDESPVYRDYPYIKGVAESFADIYMTVDNNVQERQQQLSKIAPDAANYVPRSIAGSEVVTSARASTPSFSGKHAIVPVEVWTKASIPVDEDTGESLAELNLKSDDQNKATKKIDTKDERIIHQTRRYELKVILKTDGNLDQYYVSGVPIIHRKDVAEGQRRQEDTSRNVRESRQQIHSVITSAVPKLFQEDLTDINNFVTDRAVINSFSSKYKFEEIEEIWIKQGDELNRFTVDVVVKVLDTESGSERYLRVNSSVVEKDGRFYIDNVS